MFALHIVLVLVLTSAITASSDELKTLFNEGELPSDNAKFVKNIVPSGFSPRIHNDIKRTLSKSGENSEYFKIFFSYVRSGLTSKGLTFSIYNENLRNAAVILFRYLGIMEQEKYEQFMQWGNEHMNKHMLSYAVNLNYLHSDKLHRNAITPLPCYVERPNYYVNSETITKALRVRVSANSRGEISQELETYKIYKTQGHFVINTNYSGWNLPQVGGDDTLNYFREDVALNCYYLGVHLRYPFWMSNEELDQINPRHAEHYYYLHKQLFTRYNLENEHLRYENASEHKASDYDYNPYLVYDNGLPFPTRSAVKGDWNDNRAKIKAIDIAIRESISRGLVAMDNTTAINMTEDTHISTLAKLIRANYDNVKMAKIIRDTFGFGGNRYPVNEYDPAPSALHHPETSLRDPVYWHMLQHVMKYFSDFQDSLEPFDLSDHVNDDINIVKFVFPELITYYDYHKFSMDSAMFDPNNISKKWPIFARQRRLKHMPFELNFTVTSENNKEVVVRLFMGPRCISDCWRYYFNYFELDAFKYILQEGPNVIIWSPESSARYLFYDDTINGNIHNDTGSKKKYNMFQFPGHLLIPKGNEKGLNLSLFIMVTPAENGTEPRNDDPYTVYSDVFSELDTKPIGFPFHKYSTGYINDAHNYQFYNISIYHKRTPVEKYSQFSHHLY